MSPRPGTGMSDEDLVLRAGRGDVNAFHVLTDRYQAWLIRYLLYLLGSRRDAEDVAQNTLIRAFRRMPTYRGGNFQGYLRRVATTQAYNHRRNAKTRNRYEQDAVLEVADRHAAPAFAEQDAVVKVLAVLPYPYREIVLLYHVEEMTIAEIADVLKIGTSAAKMRLKRARAQFLKIYEEKTHG